MRRIRSNICFWILFVVLLALSFRSVGSAEEYEWNFTNPQEAKTWKTVNASIGQGPDGVIFSHGYGKEPFTIFSPPGLRIPPDYSYLEFSLKVPPTNPYGYILIKTTDNKIWRKEYEFGVPGEFNVYRINLEEVNMSNAQVDTLGFTFDGGIEVELDYVKFDRASITHLLKSYWRQFWRASYITGTTINSVNAPLIGKSSFLKTLYILLSIMIAGMVVFFRPANIAFFMKSVALFLAFAGIIFSVRMDYNWYMQWLRDQRFLAHKSLGERISTLGRGEAYYTAVALNKTIPPGERVRIYSGEDYFRTIIKYYLLPLKVSERGRYILVYKDDTISFDQYRGILQKNNEVMERDVSLIVTLGKGISLYRTMGR